MLHHVLIDINSSKTQPDQQFSDHWQYEEHSGRYSTVRKQIKYRSDLFNPNVIKLMDKL